jgi:hypothetical protein
MICCFHSSELSCQSGAESMLASPDAMLAHGDIYVVIGMFLPCQYMVCWFRVLECWMSPILWSPFYLHSYENHASDGKEARRRVRANDNKDLLKSVDWRTEGAIIKVKDRGSQCKHLYQSLFPFSMMQLANVSTHINSCYIVSFYSLGQWIVTLKIAVIWQLSLISLISRLFVNHYLIGV